MASYNDLMVISRQQGFQDRIKYGLQKAAVDVMAEAGNVVSHAARVTYAGKVLLGTASINDVTIAVLTNSTIAAETVTSDGVGSAFGIPDSDIQFTVNSLFNAFAGVAN